MKKFNKILSVVLCLAMVLTMAAFTVSAEENNVATLDALTSGQYYIVCSNGEYLGVVDGTWVTKEQAVWTVTVVDGGVTLCDSNGVYIAPKGGNSNGLAKNEYVWAVTCENGMFVFAGQGGDTVKLAFNSDAQYNKFRTYKNGTIDAHADAYPCTFSLYKAEGGEAPEIPEIPEIPEEPAAIRTEKVDVLNDGEKVYIYYPDSALAITNTASGKKLSGVSAKMEEDYLYISEGAAEMTVSIDENGYYTFVCEGKYLTSGATGNGLSFAAEANDYSLWVLEEAENGWFIKNVNAAYKGNPQYLEYYSGFTTYGMNASKPAIFTFQFFQAHVCDFEAVVTAPTCTEQGYTTYTCACGESYVGDYVPASHDYVNVEETASTCTEQGSITFTCSVCQDTYIAYSELLPHDYVDGFCTVCGGEQPPCAHEPVLEGKVDVTCVINGYTGDLVCAICGEIIEVGSVVEATGHSFVEGACTVCGEGDPDYHPLDHKVQIVVIAPTCDTWGCTLHICAEDDCNKSWATDYVAPTGHTWVAATCTEAGYCSVCGEAGEAALGHTWVAPTCTEAGYCANCNAAGEPAKGHGDYQVVYMGGPTCTEHANIRVTCNGCGYEVPAEEWLTWESFVGMDKLGHDFTEATCTEDGVCTRCGEVNEPAKGHGDYQVVYMGGPTCTEHANIRVTCNGCGYEVPAEEWLTWENFVGMDKLGHSFGEATCTAPATCTRCGETEGEKLAHTEEVIPGKAPTCTETGLTEGKKCSVCGEILVAQEEVAMVEHNWDEGVVTTEPTEEATGVKTYTCSACGETKTEELPKLEHVHKYEGVVTAPTCEDGGYTTYTCECGDSYVADQVVALGHTFVDGNCTVCGSPETGDATVIIMVMSAMALMAGAAVVIGKKKYF